MTKIDMKMMMMNVEITSVIQEQMRPTIARSTKVMAMNIQYRSNFLFLR